MMMTLSPSASILWEQAFNLDGLPDIKGPRRFISFHFVKAK